MNRPGSRPGLLFQLVVPATAVFVVTVLSLIAVLFSDPRAPLAQLLDRHGNQLLLAELVVVLLLALVAMAVDRWRTLQAAKPGLVPVVDAETDQSPPGLTAQDTLRG